MERNGVVSRAENPDGFDAKEQWKSSSIRRFNEVKLVCSTRKQPSTHNDMTFGNLAGGRYFSKLNANFGRWDCRKEQNTKHLTAFVTPWGRYCFNVLSLGISSGSEKFQKCMWQILEGLDGVECNIDDVLVYGACNTRRTRQKIVSGSPTT